MEKNVITKIRPMSERRYETIPIDSIVFLNSRNRNEELFNDIVRNIDAVGLLKPPTVNERDTAKTKKYMLVCGEGRVRALAKLGHKTVVVEIINVDKKIAYLMGLIENLARTKTTTLEHIKIIAEMRRLGVSFSVLSDITGYAKRTLEDYMRIIDKGELLLLKGVEDGQIQLSFAKAVVASDASYQVLLIKGYDAGLFRPNNLRYVRSMLRERDKEKSGRKIETVKDLETEIREKTIEIEQFNFQRKMKEYRLNRLLVAWQEITKDTKFLKLMEANGMETSLKLNTNHV